MFALGAKTKHLISEPLLVQSCTRGTHATRGPQRQKRPRATDRDWLIAPAWWASHTIILTRARTRCARPVAIHARHAHATRGQQTKTRETRSDRPQTEIDIDCPSLVGLPHPILTRARTLCARPGTIMHGTHATRGPQRR